MRGANKSEAKEASESERESEQQERRGEEGNSLEVGPMHTGPPSKDAASLSLSLSLYLSPWPPSLPFYPFHFSASFCSRVASPQLALLLLPCRAIGKAKPRKIESSSDWPGDLSPISRQNAIIVSLISRNLSSEIFPRKTNG
jgi:hypothetical protein